MMHEFKFTFTVHEHGTYQALQAAKRFLKDAATMLHEGFEDAVAADKAAGLARQKHHFEVMGGDNVIVRVSPGERGAPNSFHVKDRARKGSRK